MDRIKKYNKIKDVAINKHMYIMVHIYFNFHLKFAYLVLLLCRFFEIISENSIAMFTITEQNKMHIILYS